VTIGRRLPSYPARTVGRVFAQGGARMPIGVRGWARQESISMIRMMMIAAATVIAAAPQSAWALRMDGPDAVRVLAVDLGADGVLQQGRGGGKQEDAAPRGQGGGETRGGRGQGGGREEARPSGERRQGGGQSARQTERGQPSGSADKGRGRSSSSASSASSGARGGSEGSGGRSSAAREERGNGSSSSSARSERGNGASSASSRNERGTGNGASAASGTERGNGNAPAGNGNARGPRRDRLTADALRTHLAGLSPELRRMAGSARPGERMVAGAIARGRARGLNANAFDVRGDGGRLRVLNRSGALLLDLEDNRARDLGSWRLRRLGDRQPAGNAPPFCRGGQGHPVLGREWCLDKGFGLGSRAGTLWSRGGIDDVTWRRPAQHRLDRGGLIGVLGDVIFGRLAFQSMALGYDQPLAGDWVAQPEGPRILRVHSGDYEVAELVDTNRDDRADVIYVVQPVW
jgi:hypothetical protein